MPSRELLRWWLNYLAWCAFLFPGILSVLFLIVYLPR